MARLNFTWEDWDRIEQNTLAWWAGELDRPLVYLTSVVGPFDAPPYSYLSNYPPEMSAEKIVERYTSVLEATRYYADAFPWWWVNFGPGIMAGFLGAEVHSVSEPSETVWFSPPASHSAGGPALPALSQVEGSSVEEPEPIKTLSFTYDADNVWWRRVQAITRAVVERWDGMVAVGHTDLGGNLDILASFRTTEGLLFDLVDRPEEVDRLVSQITELWLRYYDEQQALIQPPCRGTTCWTPIWSPGKTYMLQCDFSYMISPAMFERFAMPDLVACCEHLDHAFYHLDGKGEIPHLDLLLSIERLRGIQWIPGDGQPPPHEWLELLKRIRDGGKLCQVFVPPEGARTIVRNLGGRGFLFVIESGNEFEDPERAHAFLRTLQQEDISLTR